MIVVRLKKLCSSFSHHCNGLRLEVIQAATSKSKPPLRPGTERHVSCIVRVSPLCRRVKSLVILSTAGGEKKPGGTCSNFFNPRRTVESTKAFGMHGIYVTESTSAWQGKTFTWKIHGPPWTTLCSTAYMHVHAIANLSGIVYYNSMAMECYIYIYTYSWTIFLHCVGNYIMCRMCSYITSLPSVPTSNESSSTPHCCPGQPLSADQASDPLCGAQDHQNPYPTEQTSKCKIGMRVGKHTSGCRSLTIVATSFCKDTGKV